jgi:hypothetical protein
MTRGLLGIVALVVGLGACSDDDAPSEPSPRVLTTISISLPVDAIELGQSITAIAVGLDQDGAPLTIGPVTWSSDKPEVAAVQTSSGSVFGLSEGTATITASFDGKTGERTIAVARSPRIEINEIQPAANSRDGWIEFFNPTTKAADISGWTLIDSNFFGPTFTFPAGSVLQPGGFLVVEESALPFDLDGTDDTSLFSRFGVLVDLIFWPGQPGTTYGRCPNGNTLFDVTRAPTKGAANACP